MQNNYNTPDLQDAGTYAFGSRIARVEADKEFATHHNKPELQDAGT